MSTKHSEPNDCFTPKSMMHFKDWFRNWNIYQPQTRWSQLEEASYTFIRYEKSWVNLMRDQKFWAHNIWRSGFLLSFDRKLTVIRSGKLDKRRLTARDHKSCCCADGGRTAKTSDLPMIDSQMNLSHHHGKDVICTCPTTCQYAHKDVG